MENKFRAFTKAGKMQYDVVPFQWDYCIDTMWHKCIESNGSGILGSGGTEAKFEVGGYALHDKDSLMRFTGLKDKNGKEVYSGDIIQSFASGGMPIFHEIIWSDSECSFRAKYQSGDCPISQRWFDEFQKEVIGNIYENPELLK